MDSEYFTISLVPVPLINFSLNNPTVSVLAAFCAVRLGRPILPVLPFLPSCLAAAEEQLVLVKPAMKAYKGRFSSPLIKDPSNLFLFCLFELLLKASYEHPPQPT